jgi:hypothetical protein
MHHALLFNVHSLGNRRPPGPHRIATVLRNEGWDCEVIDFATTWSLDQLKELAKSRITNATVFVGFGVMFNVWRETVMEEFSGWLKKQYPNVKQIVGGQWPPVHDSFSIDYYVTGYAEVAMLELIKTLTGNQPVSKLSFDPKYFGKNKKVISGNTFYPSFPMKSLMIDYEDRDFLNPGEWLTIEAGRGCKFNCPYCTYPILGVKDDYSRDAADFALQLQRTYDKYGITNYFVSDETFNDSSEKIIKFADAVETLNFEPWFTGFIRGDLLVSRKQDWEHLMRMRFLGHFYGIETMNHQTAKAIKKGMNPERLLPGLLEAKDYFKSNGRKLYRGTIALIVGLPYESKESIAQSFDWLEKNWIGESISVSALEIPLDPTVDVLSEMSIDWDKFGYVKIADQVPELNLKNFTISPLMNSKLLWKNEHMDYIEAAKLVDDYNCFVEERGLFGASPWALDYFMHYMPLEQALASRFELGTKERFNYHVAITKRDAIDPYITKKLSS